MSRKNAKNIKSHNDRLSKAKQKASGETVARREKLAAIVKKYNAIKLAENGHKD